ncbi:MAG TPA: SRPBCC domain-containing protein [Telluria sp.]|jgi:uncharacterized protein YndB with AHSA1/START domain
MNQTTLQTRTVVVERIFPYPPEKLWRALTQPHLLEAWLMKNNFVPSPGQQFEFRADWGTVACEVTEIDPQRSLSYTWRAMGLDSVVTWTLAPTAQGTLLLMAQSGFRTDQEQAYQGAKFGWTRMLDSLEQLLKNQG